MENRIQKFVDGWHVSEHPKCAADCNRALPDEIKRLLKYFGLKTVTDWVLGAFHTAVWRYEDGGAYQERVADRLYLCLFHLREKGSLDHLWTSDQVCGR